MTSNGNITTNNVTTNQIKKRYAPGSRPPTDPEERHEWSKQMRLLFTNKEMLNEDGALKLEYFKPKPKVTSTVQWGAKEKEEFYDGLTKFGVGSWKAMKDHYNSLAPHDLRLKLMRLIGRQDLGEYFGLRLTEADVAAQFERNQKIGREHKHLWKNGMIVKDEQGTAERLIKETEGTLTAVKKRTASAPPPPQQPKKRKITSLQDEDQAGTSGGEASPRKKQASSKNSNLENNANGNNTNGHHSTTPNGTSSTMNGNSNTTSTATHHHHNSNENLLPSAGLEKDLELDDNLFLMGEDDPIVPKDFLSED